MKLNRYRSGKYSTYWSCSGFANWIISTLGTKKPTLGTEEQWTEWRITKPINTIIEDWLDGTQDIFMLPYDIYDTIRIYVRNRFITRTHLIDTKLTPGDWHESDDRLLYGLFAILVDFIEVEKSGYGPERPWWFKLRFLRWGKYRSVEGGLAHLDWEIALKDNGDYPELCNKQSKAAQEQKDLYLWWTTIRPNRGDVTEITGYTKFCEEVYPDDVGVILTQKLTPEQESTQGQILNDIYRIEHDWEQEDQDMMIRLIKIKQYLWT